MCDEPALPDVNSRAGLTGAPDTKAAMNGLRSITLSGSPGSVRVCTHMMTDGHSGPFLTSRTIR